MFSFVSLFLGFSGAYSKAEHIQKSHVKFRKTDLEGMVIYDAMRAYRIL